jgi:hypothetical protein
VRKKRMGQFYMFVYFSLSGYRYNPNGVLSRTPDDKVSHSTANRIEQKNKLYIVDSTDLLVVCQQPNRKMDTCGFLSTGRSAGA